MDCNGYKYSKHAILRMAERNIFPSDVKFCLSKGEIIAEYPSAKPYPALILLVYLDNIPLHVCASKDEFGSCVIITDYIPNELEWEANFKIKKS